MNPKVVPASGERNSKGKKVPAPKKYSAAFTFTACSPTEAKLYADRLLNVLIDRQTARLISGEVTPDEASKLLAPLRTINRVIHNMTENEFKERNERAPSPNDFQGTLF
jgi:hypothetical protein